MRLAAWEQNTGRREGTGKKKCTVRYITLEPKEEINHQRRARVAMQIQEQKTRKGANNQDSTTGSFWTESDVVKNRQERRRNVGGTAAMRSVRWVCEISVARACLGGSWCCPITRPWHCRSFLDDFDVVATRQHISSVIRDEHRNSLTWGRHPRGFQFCLSTNRQRSQSSSRW